MTGRLIPALDRRWRLVPFRAKLTLGFAGVMVILFGGLALLLDTVVENNLNQQINRSLQTHAVDLATLVDHRRASPALILPDSDGTFAQIAAGLQAGGRVIASTSGHRAPLLTDSQLRLATRRPVVINAGNSRLLAGPVDTDPRSVLVVGISLAQRNHMLTLLNELLFIGGPILLLLTCVAGYVLAARALAPVTRMSGQAAMISGMPGGQRLPTPEARDEIRQLGNTLNALLSRVDDALARERSFVADASHELRTPLAVLKLELEFALASDISREELQARIGSAAEEVDRLTKVAQDLLFIARAGQGRLPLEKQTIGVHDILTTVAERFQRVAHMHGRSVRIALDADTEMLAVDADPTWIAQALNNFVTNAFRYGEGDVVLTTKRQADSIEIHVIDAGHGFEPSFLRCAFERFARSNPASVGQGAGLGLSIVKIIADAHDGSAGAANREAGGADVWISLPLHPRPPALREIATTTGRPQ